MKNEQKYYSPKKGHRYGLLDMCCWSGCNNSGAQEFYRGEGKNRQYAWVCFEHAEIMSEIMSGISKNNRSLFEKGEKLEKDGTILWNVRILAEDPKSLGKRIQRTGKAMGIVDMPS